MVGKTIAKSVEYMKGESMHVKKMLCAACSALLSASGAWAAASWSVEPYDTAEWEATSNLLSGLAASSDATVYTTGDRTPRNHASVLTDGQGTTVTGIDYQKVNCVQGGSVAWDLPQPADLTEVRVFTCWADGGRDGVNIDRVSCKVLGSDSWQDVAGSVSYGNNDNFTPGAYAATFKDAGNVPIAQFVTAIKVVFSSTQDNNGTGYMEIEALGSPSATDLMPRLELAVDETTVDYQTATLTGVVSTVGSEAASADFYFAYGKSPSPTPVLRTQGLAGDAALEIPLADLDDDTTYYYAAYLDNGTYRSGTVEGAFRTRKNVYRNLPAGYTQVEYLSSSSGAYVITGIEPTTKTRAELDFVSLEHTGGADIGCMSDDNADWRFFDYSGGSMFDVGTVRLGFNGAAVGQGGTLLTVGTRYKVVFGLDPEDGGRQLLRILTDEHVLLYEETKPTGGAVKADERIYIFGGKNGGGASTAKMTLYSLLVYEDGELAGDFVPCVRDSDGALGLYDLASGLFLGNANASESAVFTAGNPVPAPDAATASAEVLSVAKWGASIALTADNLAGAATCDLYFACGTDRDALEPEKVAEGLAEGATSRVDLDGLNDSTTYYFAYYLVTSGGARSLKSYGSFKTAYAEPVAISVTRGSFDSTTVELLVTIDSLGEEGTSADVYFAVGTTDSLVPALSKTGLGAGETAAISATGLAPGQVQYWAVYAKNQLGHFCPTVTGSFTTYEDSAVPKWVGRVSSDWSEPGNWDPETVFENDGVYEKVVLGAFANAYPPSNLDLSGVSIGTIELGAGVEPGRPCVVGGQPFSLGGFTADGGANGTLRVMNDVLAGQRLGCTLRNAQATVELYGVVTQGAAGEEFLNSDQAGTLLLMNPSNRISGKVVAHSQVRFGFASDGALGPAPAALSDDAIRANWGEIWAVAPVGKDYQKIEVAPTRGQVGTMRLVGGVDVAINAPVNLGVQYVVSADSVRHLSLNGTTVPADGGSSPFGGNSPVSANGGILVRLCGETTAQEEGRALRMQGANCDLNGKTVTMPLNNYGAGHNQTPIFFNGDRAHAATVKDVVPHEHIGVTDVFFGGPGDIAVTGSVKVETNNGATFNGKNALRKIGAGKLTLACVDSAYDQGTDVRGDLTLDYTTYATPKLGGTPGQLTMGLGTLEQKGDCAAGDEITSIRHEGGLVVLKTSGGAKMTIAEGFAAGHIQRGDFVDIQGDVSLGTQANRGDFPGLGPQYTLGGGADWACVDGDGAIAAIPASAYAEEFLTGLWDLPAGTTELAHANCSPDGIRYAGAGDATLRIPGTVDVQKRGQEDAAAILFSSQAGGDLTIEGGTLKSQNYNGALDIINWNTSHTLVIHSRIPETNDNDLNVVGPGTTVLDNDDNSFYYGPHVYGGATVKFTSIADRNAHSALGGARNENGWLAVGHGCTFEYVGTAAEGHSSNRRFILYGDVTIKANGVGPMTLASEVPIASGYSTSRLILAGDADKAGGVISGRIDPGLFGSVVKRGTGTWEVDSTTSEYNYPTEVEAGTLVWNGTIPSHAKVSEGAVLATTEGLTVRRDLDCAGELVLPLSEDRPPLEVWGTARITGTIRLMSRPRPGVTYTLLGAQNGCEAAGLRIEGMSVVVTEDGVTARRPNGFSMVVR